jgi:C-terminal processing protease CtpA/Prc
MKKMAILTLSTGTALILGAGLLYRPNQPAPIPKAPAENLPEPVIDKTAPPPVIAETKPVVEVLDEPVIAEQPAPPPVPTPEPKPAPLTSEERQRIALERYYTQMAKNFDRMMDRLDQEQNPERRRQLIDTLARYVRVDTLAALDWAASLQDPDEQRAALEAINKNALTGIGARIEIDATGLPKIRNTTILSAVESTGLVEPGDYISGVVNPDGTTVYFQGLSIQEIVEHLRGEPGSEVQLLMERLSENGDTASFDVPLQRSLIVMQPSY